MTKKEAANVKVGDRLYLRWDIQIGTGRHGKHIKLLSNTKVVFKKWDKDKAVCSGPICGTLFDNYDGILRIEKRYLIPEPKFVISKL